MHIINYIENNVNEKLKAQAEKYLLECRNGFRNSDPASIHRLASNNVEKKYESLTFYEPCVLYIGRAYHYPPNVAFYIFFSTNISTEYFKHAAHSPFFLFKMPFIS